MKIKTWPTPPVRETYTVPEIPTEFKVFGVEYTVEGEIKLKGIETTPLDRDRIKSLIKETYKRYLNVLTVFKGIEKIEEIHFEINEELNKSKREEIEFELKRLRNEKNKKLNKSIELLEGVMFNKGGWL